MRRPRSVVHRAVVRYAVASLLVVGMLGLVLAVVGARLVTDEALVDAEQTTRNMADVLASPLVDDAVRDGEPEAVERVGRVLDHRMRDGSVTHIVIYDESGLVLWSDNEAIRGLQVPLEADVQALFGTEDSLVGAPGEDEAHPWNDPSYSDLIETYVGARDADGEPFVFETYTSPQRIDRDRYALLTTLLPYVAAAIALFLLATLPLAIGLARRVDRAAARRSELLADSVRALHDDRRRVAQYLHDGVIQDLSVAGYTLNLLATSEPGAGGPDDRTRETADRLAAMLQDDVHQLRALVVDLVPDQLEGDLASALAAIGDRGRDRYGLDVRLRVDGPAGVDDLDDTTSRLVFQVVREGVANVGRHARATTATVLVDRRPEDVVVSVTDDGVGPGTPAADDEDHHLGLRLLTREVEGCGGHLELSAAPGGGAVLSATIPVLGDPA
ncbi:MAG TPA: histidine kinase [Nocardioides sp.]|nr:histidine kinase [Nocardioides sp.]